MDWADGLQATFGYAVADVQPTGAWWSAQIHPDDRDRVQAAFEAILQTAASRWTDEYRFRRCDGSFAIVADQGYIVRDASGRPLRLIGSLNDLTERRQREREREAISTVAAALRTAQDRTEMLPVILDQVAGLLQAGGAVLALRDPTTGETHLVLGNGVLAESTGLRIPPGQGVTWEVIETGRPFVGEIAPDDPRYYRPDILSRARYVACVPLLTQLRTLGTLWAGRDVAFGDSEVRVLTAIADMAANAIQRASLHERTERQVRRLAALHAIDMAIASSFDLRMTLTVILEQVTAQLGADAADILTLNPLLQTLDYAASRGFHTRPVTRAHLRLGDSQAGQAALTRRIVSVPDLAGERAQFKDSKVLAEEKFVCYFCAPLIAKGEVKGVLEVFHRASLTPDEEWLDYLETLAGQVAIAIDNANLFTSLQRSNLELSLAYDATIEGWSRALDLRDKETEGHTRRVTETAVRLARVMGLSEIELVHLRRGALLHDIGKMGVPDGILLKPGKLTDEEWAIMRLHPQYAFEMLAPINYLRPALDIPFCHHEKWDGTGYPRGLKGEQIPLAARIFAVVDVWDALRSDRPYRPAWPDEKVTQHIRTLSGTHFDPEVVEVFLRMLREGGAIGNW